MIHAMTSRQFRRFAVVGLISNTTIYIAYLGLTSAGLNHKIAMTLLYVLGMLLTFTANRTWSFQHNGMAHTAFVRYLIAYALGYLLNLLLLWFAVDLFHMPHQAVQAAAIIMVAVGLFLMQKYWVFTPPYVGGRTQ